MTLIERIQLRAISEPPPRSNESVGNGPGLRVDASIGVRTSTSSFSDYPEWDVNELRKDSKAFIVTDGTCS